jgi:hypothetical protein
MRSRQVKKEYPQLSSTASVSREARLLQVLLPLVADDEGRLRVNVPALVEQLYPRDADAMMMMPVWLAELQAARCIELYSSGGEEFLYILNWWDLQKIDHPKFSVLPPPPSYSPDDARHVATLSRQRRDKGVKCLEENDFSGNRDNFEEIFDSAQEAGEVTRDTLLRIFQRVGAGAASGGRHDTALKAADLMGRYSGLRPGAAGGKKEADKEDDGFDHLQAALDAQKPDDAQRGALDRET